MPRSLSPLCTAPVLGLFLFASFPGPLHAEPTPADAPLTLAADRVVVRWHTPELGGATETQVIFERQLAFEARLESLAEGQASDRPFEDRHIRDAMDRNISETLLSQLPVSPAPQPTEVAKRAEDARVILEQRVGGRARLRRAAHEEGITSDELDRMLRRRARASMYLDRMVAPMLEPSEVELIERHQSGETPFTDRPYAEVAPALKRWLIAERVRKALDVYFRNARARITIDIVG